MKEMVCGICGEDIVNPDEPCPFCGAEPNYFVEKGTVDQELLRKIYEEGGATY